jgi:hypothetical protein
MVSTENILLLTGILALQFGAFCWVKAFLGLKKDVQNHGVCIRNLQRFRLSIEDALGPRDVSGSISLRSPSPARPEQDEAAAPQSSQIPEKAQRDISSSADQKTWVCPAANR